VPLAMRCALHQGRTGTMRVVRKAYTWAAPEQWIR
jgi:hypothetical protein